MKMLIETQESGHNITCYYSLEDEEHVGNVSAVCENHLGDENMRRNPTWDRAVAGYIEYLTPYIVSGHVETGREMANMDTMLQGLDKT